MSVIKKMSKAEALATLVKAADIQQRLLKKISMHAEDEDTENEEDEDTREKIFCRWCEENPVIHEGTLCIECEDEGVDDM